MREELTDSEAALVLLTAYYTFGKNADNVIGVPKMYEPSAAQQLHC